MNPKYFKEYSNNKEENNMKYRVILKVSYHEAWFEFDTIEEAGEFAKAVLLHQVESPDSKKKSTIKVEVIDPTAEEENEDD